MPLNPTVDINLSNVFERLSDRRAVSLKAAVEDLAASIAGERVSSADFVKHKEIINRAVEEAFSHLNESQHDWSYDTLVMGAWNVPAALAEATRKGHAARTKLLTALLPLHQLLQSAKLFIVKRADAVPNAATRPSHQLTCQVCGRAIGAAVGAIAPHGYRRPGNSSQTASCDGAGYAPFEASRGRLAQLIQRLNAQNVVAASDMSDVEAERRPVSVYVNDYSQPPGAYGGRPLLRFEMTRENATHVLASIPSDGDVPLKTFEQAKMRDIASRKRHIEHVCMQIAELRQRHDEWTMTIEWDAETGGWKAIELDRNITGGIRQRQGAG